jgi:uncharacterized membrane protein YqiK
MFGWHIPAPDQAMLISGGKQKGDLPFRIVTGHGAYVIPVFKKVSYLTLSLLEATVEEDCVSQQGITLRIQAVIAFKVADDPDSIANAARRFLEDQSQMSALTGRIFAGHLRSIIGSMTVEDLIRERQKLATEVLDQSKGEMAKIGLAVDSLQIESIDDLGVGYIAALAAPHTAAVNQAAKIAQSRADQASEQARQESLRNQAEYERQTAVAKAAYQAEIDRANQTAAQAGPLAAAQAQQDVLVEQSKVAKRNADLREAQLVAEVVKPAEAEASRILALAKAQADSTKLSAEAAAAEGRISLDQAVIAHLPAMMEAIASGLASSNLTILNGAEGLNGLVASMATQGAAILQQVRTTFREGGTVDGDYVEDAPDGPDHPRPVA